MCPSHRSTQYLVVQTIPTFTFSLTAVINLQEAITNVPPMERCTDTEQTWALFQFLMYLFTDMFGMVPKTAAVGCSMLSSPKMDVVLEETLAIISSPRTRGKRGDDTLYPTTHVLFILMSVIVYNAPF